jgi:hypothetical protein
MLRRQTLYYAMNYVDRYLSIHHDVKTSKLQLVGVTALSIASKVEEIFPPMGQAFSNTTDGAFDVTAIYEMESQMLKTLDWVLNPPTHYGWMVYLVHYLSRGASPLPLTSFLDQLPSFNGPSFSEGRNTGIYGRERLNSISSTCSSAASSFPSASSSSYRGSTPHPLDPSDSFPVDLFVKAMEAIDLCVLDYNSLQFRPSLLAAAVLSVYVDDTAEICRLAECTEDEVETVKTWALSRLEGCPANLTIHAKINQILREPRMDWHTYQTYNENALTHIKSIEEREAEAEAERELVSPSPGSEEEDCENEPPNTPPSATKYGNDSYITPSFSNENSNRRSSRRHSSNSLVQTPPSKMNRSNSNISKKSNHKDKENQASPSSQAASASAGSRRNVNSSGLNTHGSSGAQSKRLRPRRGRESGDGNAVPQQQEEVNDHDSAIRNIAASVVKSFAGGEYVGGMEDDGLQLLSYETI